MTDRVEKVFTVAVEPARAWSAFADGNERAKWEAATYEIDPVVGGAYRWTIGSIEGGGQVTAAVPEKLMRQHEQTGHANSEITVTFETVESGTRISITHAGFGDEPWDEWIEATSLGWDQAIADLVAYLETGVVAGRFSTPFENPGMKVVETIAGLRVEEVAEGGLGAQAGVQAGDLLLTVGDTAIYRINELWVICRQATASGADVTIEYVHDGERSSGSGRLGTIAWLAPAG